MNEKEIIKFLDLVFNKITDFNLFAIDNILFKELNINEKNKNEVEKLSLISKEVNLFGKNNDLFEAINGNGWLSLTEKGKELKISKLGFVKFTKKNKAKKIDLYKIVAIILTIVFGVLNVFQKYDYRELKNNYDFIKSERDSLKHKLDDLNNKTVEYKARSLSDTLITKMEFE